MKDSMKIYIIKRKSVLLSIYFRKHLYKIIVLYDKTKLISRFHIISHTSTTTKRLTFI